MVRLRRRNLTVVVFTLVAGDLRFGGGRCDLWSFVYGGGFGHGGAGYGGDLDLGFGFNDFRRKTSGVGGGGREEIDGGDEPDGWNGGD